MRSSRATRTSSTGSAVSEMRMVSPIPSASRMPSPAALFTVPARSVPASVTPRWSGESTRAEKFGFARTDIATACALSETLISR